MVIEDPDSRALTNQTTYANLPTDPMSITLPALAGDYDIEIQANIIQIGAGTGRISYAVGGTAASNDWSARTTGAEHWKAARQRNEPATPDYPHQPPSRKKPKPVATTRLTSRNDASLSGR